MKLNWNITGEELVAVAGTECRYVIKRNSEPSPGCEWFAIREQAVPDGDNLARRDLVKSWDAESIEEAEKICQNDFNPPTQEDLVARFARIEDSLKRLWTAIGRPFDA